MSVASFFFAFALDVLSTNQVLQPDRSPAAGHVTIAEEHDERVRLPRAMTPGMRAAIRQLIGEALELQREHQAPPDEPDFALRLDKPLDESQVQAALLRRLHDDSFVDAYVRWQLLSLQPTMPRVSGSAFRLLLAELPALPENPAADTALIDLLERASHAGPLNREDLQRLRSIREELNHRLVLHEAMARPALELRRWVQEGVRHTSRRYITSLLEELEATVLAGRPPRAVKAALTRAFTSAHADSQMERADLRSLAEAANRLAGLRRRYVRDITFFQNRTVGVSFGTSQVPRRDVDRWLSRLAHGPPG